MAGFVLVVGGISYTVLHKVDGSRSASVQSHGSRGLCSWCRNTAGSLPSLASRLLILSRIKAYGNVRHLLINRLLVFRFRPRIPHPLISG